MNRQERRRKARLREEWEDRRHLQADYECPDCHADTRLVQQHPGLYTLLVFHDETCPSYQAMPPTT